MNERKTIAPKAVPMVEVTVERNLNNIPDELKELSQWVVCSNVKVPIIAKYGGNASSTNPDTWSPYEKAREVVLSGKYKHVGFVFTENDPYVGVDLDDAINSKGKVKPWAQKIIDLLDSYTEVSQSGEGIHIIIRGKKPGDKCKHGDVEIYERSRYFALTGNLLDGVHASIEDRQDQLSDFYAKTFGEVKTGPSDKTTSDLVLHQDANPPADKLKKMLKDDRFLETWEFKRADLNDNSLSGHDLALASQLVVVDCEDQEIADFIIAFRRRHGDGKDLKKALRLDYIQSTIDKARDRGVLELLPFGVKEVIQYGDQDAEFTIVTESEDHIDMGNTSAFLSPKHARQRFLERGYFLSPKAYRLWSQMIKALMPFRIEALPTMIEETEEWLRLYLAGRDSILLIDPDDPDLPDSLSKALTVWSSNAVMRDKQGRIYFSLSRAINDARRIFGPSFSMKSLALRLKKMGFKSAGVASDYSGGKRSQARMWMSEVGYLPPIVEDVETPAISSREGNFSSVREEIEAAEGIEAEDRAEEASQKLADKSAGIIRMRYEKP